MLLLPPHHLINNSSVGLDDLDDFVADVFDIDGNRDAEAVVVVHADGGVNGLEKGFLVNA